MDFFSFFLFSFLFVPLGPGAMGSLAVLGAPNGDELGQMGPVGIFYLLFE